MNFKTNLLLIIALSTISIIGFGQSNISFNTSLLVSSNKVSIDDIAPKEKSPVKAERKKSLHNFSDSVFTIQLPSDLAFQYQCEDFETLYDQLVLGEDTAEKDKPKIAFFDDCKEEMVFIDDYKSIPEAYFTNEEYFNIWDSKNVNPYDYPLKNFNDTVKIKLYDPFKQTKSWSPPIKNTKINSKYGARWYRWHHGVDLDLEIGDPVHAAFEGVVRIAKYNRGGYGYYIMLRHENGLETLYGHLTSFNVEVGDKVKAGDLIGLGGNTGRSTGAHLHFEVRYKGHAFDPRFLYDFEHDKLHYQEFYLTPYHYKELITQAKSKYHRVRSGESLWVIARKYRTSISTLCRLNGISRRTTLRIGKKLRVR